MKQGPFNGTVAVDVDPGTANPWLSLGNAIACDGATSDCAVTNTGASDLLQVTGFGFSIPSNATNVTLTVNVKRKSFSGNAVDQQVTLASGFIAINNKADFATLWPIVLTVASYVITNADAIIGQLDDQSVNDPAFGIQIQAADSSVIADLASIDCITMSVTYDIIPAKDYTYSPFPID